MANQSRSHPPEIRRIPSGVDLPALMQLNPSRYPFLLQSIASGPEQARYDILFAFPGATLTLAADGDLSGPWANPSAGFLGSLDSWWTAEFADSLTTVGLPFSGGWFLYLGYELAREIEPGLNLRGAPGLPVAFATRVPVAVVIDQQAGSAWLVAEAGHSEQLELLTRDIAALKPTPPATLGRTELHEPAADEFLAAVDRAKGYIRAGDIYQANLSRRWQGFVDGKLDPLLLYRRLCASNPAPFAGCISRPDFALLSSSPERLVRRRGSQIDTRPIAGTRPRHAETPGQVNRVRDELLNHPKERAEHIMLIDLERNDLGKVCKSGSVAVSEYMVIETYSHVHHIVSNVRGIAKDGLKPGELIRAVFPGGTITGVPKVRCMEIIAELEAAPRGAYTGSMGYLNRNGDCDLNILIRTITCRGNRIDFSAGSGIVADSDPLRELEETRAKAKGLLLALTPDA